MTMLYKMLLWLLIIAASFTLLACSDSNESVNKGKPNSQILEVYKSPTCGCCSDWIDHVEAAGFETFTHHPADLSLIKKQFGIKPSSQSCHTAVSKNGYVFEGHIPADVMLHFIESPPENAIGLAVSGMPIGSPGMEMGNHYEDYAVLLINKDGSTEVYQEIKGEGPGD